jgi:hypothetical protein
VERTILPAPGSRLKDRYKGLLWLRSRFFILTGDRLRKQVAQYIELPVRCLELPVEKPDAFDEHANMRDGGFGDAWGDNQRLLFQDGENFSRIDSSNAMAPQQFLDLRQAQPGRLGGRWRHLPQLQDPLFRKIGVKLEHLGIIALELTGHFEVRNRPQAAVLASKIHASDWQPVLRVMDRVRNQGKDQGPWHVMRALIDSANAAIGRGLGGNK